jgi:hypothetical protein
LCRGLSLEAGDTLDQFLDHFPTVTRQMAIEALECAKEKWGRTSISPLFSMAMWVGNRVSKCLFQIFQFGRSPRRRYFV